MTFKEWLKIQENGTSSGSVGGGSTTSADIARVPTRIPFGMVTRKFLKNINKGLGYAGSPAFNK